MVTERGTRLLPPISVADMLADVGAQPASGGGERLHLCDVGPAWNDMIIDVDGFVGIAKLYFDEIWPIIEEDDARGSRKVGVALHVRFNTCSAAQRDGFSVR